MKKQLLMAVSAIALLAAAPAFAAQNTTNQALEERTVNQGDTPHLTKEETRKAWENTKEAVSDAAKDAGKAIENTYDDIKASMQNQGSGKIERVAIDPRVTAKGLIGKPVYNEKGERVATIHDIILDTSGDADNIILSDGKFSGFGDLVAVDFDDLATQGKDGYLLSPLSAKIIEDGTTFKYKKPTTATTEKVAYLENNVSVKELLGSNVLDTAGKSVAKIDDVSFNRGQADRLIIKFGQILGMGGDKAAMTFADVAVKQDAPNENVRVELSNNTLQEFQAYKKSLK